jgi:methyl-accepting chemotaxis protein/ActR/RegA family two-component response regulator
VDTFLGSGSAAYKPIQSGKEYIGNAVILGKDYLTAYHPLFQPNTREIIGIIFIGIEMSSIQDMIVQNSSTAIKRISLIAAGLLLVSVLLTSLSSRFVVVKPIIKVAGILKHVAEGDLTKGIKISTKDEIGDLAHDFNFTVERIRNLIGAIKNKVNALTNTGHELSSNMAKTSEAVSQISVNFGEMENMVGKQEQGAADVDSAVKNIQTNIANLSKSIEEQTESISVSSSAVEKMNENIHSVTKTLLENSKSVIELASASDNGKTGLQAVAQKILEIAGDSEGLLEINAVMNNIASQTNLLSMNAAIEAAHAGEAGKGFAVVADEIRKLAESSGQQSKTTAEMLKKIKASIDSITVSSNDVISRFDAIDDGVKTVSQHEENIRSAMEGQETGGRQILDSMTRLKELNTSVKNGSDEMLESGNYLIRQTNDFIQTSKSVVSGMNEIVNGAMREIQSAVNLVNDISAENSRNFDGLKVESEKFKVDSGAEKKKIILVDDDLVHLGMVKEMLREKYDVITAGSGKEALTLFRQGLVPQLILLDIVMPEMGGWDVFDRIKSIGGLHDIPMAFFTVSDNPDDMERSRQMGAVDHIKKPISKTDLLARVEKILKTK